MWLRVTSSRGPGDSLTLAPINYIDIDVDVLLDVTIVAVYVETDHKYTKTQREVLINIIINFSYTYSKRGSAGTCSVVHVVGLQEAVPPVKYYRELREVVVVR